MKPFSFVLICFLLSGIGASVVTLIDDLRENHFAKELQNVSFADEFVFRWDQVQNPQIAKGLAQYLYRVSRDATSSEHQRETLCQALSHVERALVLEPEEPMTNIALLEVGTALSGRGYSCEGLGQGLSDASKAAILKPQSLLRYVSYLSPYDPSVQFHVGRIAEKYGLHEIATDSFRRFLSVAPRVGDKQAEYLEDWLFSNPKDSRLTHVLPTNIAGITFWSRRVINRSESSSLDFDETVNARAFEQLATLQRAAVEKRWQEVQEGGFPVLLFLDEVLSLVSFSANDTVRRELDSTLVHVAEKFRPASDAKSLIADEVLQYLRMRANYGQLPVISGWNGYDLNPKVGLLSDWDQALRVVFDQKYRSLGFVKPDNSQLKLITIETLSPLTPDILQRVKLFSSNNNIEWQEINGSAFRAELVTVGSKSVIIFTLKDLSAAKLWKVHYASKSDEGRIQGFADEILSAFGSSSGNIVSAEASREDA